MSTMLDQQRKTLITGAVFMFLCVAFGAFGAHALKEMLTEVGARQYDLGIRYAFIHALAILIAALARPLAVNAGQLSLAVWFFIAGIVLFAGSLILLGVTQNTLFALFTPLGGLSFLMGWGMFIFSMRAVK